MSLDASELSDNISINSDDTDILLLKNHNVDFGDYEGDKILNVSQNDYVNAENSVKNWKLEYSVSPNQTGTSKFPDGEYDDLLDPGISFTSNSYGLRNRNSQYATGKTVSFDEKPSLVEEDRSVSHNSSSSLHSHHDITLSEIDAKVREGQEILRRLLSGSDHVQTNSFSFKSPIEKLNTSTASSITNTTSPEMVFQRKANTSNMYSEFENHLLTHTKENLPILENDVKCDTQQSIDLLQKELESIKILKAHEMQLLKEQHNEELTSLQECIAILEEQKFSLTDHVSQLKKSLSEKNTRCVELQDKLHEKTKQIHKLTSKDSKERQSLQNQVQKLQNRENILEQQVNDVEKAFNNQFKQIKELDERFKKEKQTRMELLQEKEEEIISLHEHIKKQNQAVKMSDEKKQMQHEQQLKDYIQQEHTRFQSELDQLKESLTREQSQKVKIKKQHSLECDRFKINLEALKSTNLKLKQDLEDSQKEVQNLRLEFSSVSQETYMKNIEEDKAYIAVKEKLQQTEKFLKTIALDLIEENTKLAVIVGSSIKSSSPANDGKSGNIVTDAVNLLKDNVENIRHYVLSLQHANESLQNHEQTIDENADSVDSSPTSARLLRHLQSRVQQLRKENASLKQSSYYDQETSLDSLPEVVKLENRVQELEVSLQRYELDSQRNTHLLHQRTMELTKLQKVLTQATKENMKLERKHAQLHKSMEENTVSEKKSPQEYVPDKEEQSQQRAAAVRTNSINSPSKLVSRIKPLHRKALGPDYLGTNLKKFIVPQEFVSWDVKFMVYTPVTYTSSKVLNKPAWADPDITDTKEALQFNSLDGKVDRRSHRGDYKIINGVPRNPIGRTGMIGRGLLGRWGPNHAADPIVTRWLRNENGSVVTKHGKKILEFIAIQRRDSDEWAIPGGMVDPGENVSATLKREFSEEALNLLDANPKVIADLKTNIDNLFQKGVTIYKGYVDDPRNTDNSWMETIVVNYHDENGNSVAKLPLNHGDDAKGVKWIAIDKKLLLYASHADFIKATCQQQQAYYED
ncbi:uveal autoantigen with coiled-coil domains and ankyrin repeats protein-like isoform X2 [Hydractinia symbiolongicarpus]|uniref:uveal autoantigen with coiled-coil domains and ankyrin repeats protein-like isoform X2 n=1 Tax=Hydractinia symbiolongicarpus TaxID=13093 RepID=UPI002551AD53|nr:uveal autoantigen with coiled-coil domains and ankyrin repeats protein-like isoform X2 [Hydractinia symbiolongicarpus]